MAVLHPFIGELESRPDYLQSNWCLPPDAARFLYLLARIGKFRRMLEIGTSIGYSTLHLALAASCQEGRVTTIDASNERQAQAVKNIEEAGLATYVTPILGEAIPSMEALIQEERTFDFVFIDAHKPEYLKYAQMAEQLLMPGGILLADNTRSHRESMGDFIAYITDSPRWDACDMETPNGFILAQIHPLTKP